MRFDVFYELSVPPFGGRSERDVYAQTLNELEAAERHGFSTAWLVEHHFMREYSHSSSPDLFLAAASQRTRHLRLGHAIIPLPYAHPVRTAERLATLDVLSGGRVEFGFGRGFSPAEYAAFGVAMADSRSVTQEALEIIQQSFSGEPLHYRGRHFQLDGVEVLPKVVQHPHPPIWTAAVSPDSFEMAARLGIGALVGPFKPWFMVKEDIKRYRRAWREHHGAGAPSPHQNPRVGMTLGVLCLEDGARARELAAPGLTWFYRQLLGQTYPVLEQLYESYEYYRKMGHLRSLLGKAVNLTVLETLGMAVVGDPAHCRKRFEALARAGVDHVLCAVGAGALPTEVVQESMAVLASEVMPHLGAAPP
ncbi:LLM class flavin-dependent oxidoreductase [Ectothiorhodospiraceae bacterium 2226]|nr:LLM class flavin-dependent oxidoreductase [Ectothiorhodospiraceae bacterium 2226]